MSLLVIGGNKKWDLTLQVIQPSNDNTVTKHGNKTQLFHSKQMHYSANILWEYRTGLLYQTWLYDGCISSSYNIWNSQLAKQIVTLSHLSQVNNEAVSLVEAGPGHVHLCCSDGPPTLDVQQALHVHIVGLHMVKTWGNAPFLWQK